MQIDINTYSPLLKISEVPPSMLEKIPSSMLCLLSKRAIQDKNYNAYGAILKHAFKNELFPHFDSFFRDCLESLDLQAVTILVKHLPHEVPLYNHEGSFQHSRFLAEIFGALCDSASEYRNHRVVMHDELSEFYKNAARIVVDAMQIFSVADLATISMLFPKVEFDQLVVRADINITNSTYDGLNLEHYKLAEKTPLLENMLNTDSVIIDSLLTRSYSEVLTQEKVKEVYRNLMNLNNEIITKVMQYTATTILDGSSNIAITFAPNTTSYFAPYQNLIKVSTDIKTDFHTLELIFMHELTHYFFNQIYQAAASPFRLSELKDLSFDVIVANNNNNEAVAMTLKQFQRLFNSDVMDAYLDHIRAEQAFVIEAGKILGCGIAEQNAANFQKATAVEYVKFVCPEIGFINLATGGGFVETSDTRLTNNHTALSTDDIVSLSQMYNKCATINFTHYAGFVVNPVCYNITFDEMKNETLNNCIPQIINEKQLDNDELFFISRVSDWASRGNEMFSYFGSDEDRFVELMVRLPEFVAAGLKHEIIQGLALMQHFWDKHVIPDIDKALDLYADKCADPVNNMPCLGGAVQDVAIEA